MSLSPKPAVKAATITLSPVRSPVSVHNQRPPRMWGNAACQEIKVSASAAGDHAFADGCVFTVKTDNGRLANDVRGGKLLSKGIDLCVYNVGCRPALPL